MPILKNSSIYYSIPHNIQKELDYRFCKTFMKELHNIWGFSLNDFNWDSLGYCEGTGGFDEAFVTTCRLLKKDKVFLHYASLPWYDSDLFDGELSDLLSLYKFILPKTEIDEVARQNDISVKKIRPCYKCGDYYLKDDISKLPKDDEDYFKSKFEKQYGCNKCLGKKNNKKKKLSYDITIAISEVLGLEEKDYFVCEKCGKYHLMFNKTKGQNVCNHCIIDETSENKNANKHYQESIILNEKYRYGLKSKEYKVKDKIIIISYNKETDMFIGKYEDGSEIQSKSLDELKKNLKR